MDDIFFLPLKILLGLRKANSYKIVSIECTPLIPVLGKQRRCVSEFKVSQGKFKVSQRDSTPKK